MEENLQIFKEKEEQINFEYSKVNKSVRDKDSALNTLNAQVKQIHKEKNENWIQKSQRLTTKIATIQKEKQALENRTKEIMAQKAIAEKLIRKTKKEREKIYAATVENMYTWMKVHQNKNTGLLASFEGNINIKNWGFTYDQTLACLVFLIFDDIEKAKDILLFYDKHAKKKQGAYFSAYNVRTGSVTEPIICVGPNLWIAIAALQYTHITGDDQFLHMAKDIAKWTIKLKDKENGIPGGPDFSWYSTEHNIDAFAVFDMLAQLYWR